MARITLINGCIPLSNYGWDTRGIHILAEALDLRYFQASPPGKDDEHEGGEPPRSLQETGASHTNPLSHFARLGLPFPKSLLGYQPEVDTKEQRGTIHPASPRPNDIPADYLKARAVHLCPLEYMTATRLISTFRQAGLPTLTLDPSPACMTAAAFEEMRALLHGLTAFIPSEQELRGLFWGRTDDLWQMAEALGDFGCEFIIVKRGARGQMLYDFHFKKTLGNTRLPGAPGRSHRGGGCLLRRVPFRVPEDV